MRKQRGLTLIELVIAIGVFALFSAMAYGALNRIMSQRDRLENEQVFWRTLSLVFVRIEEDLAQARPRRVRDIDGNVLPSFRGQPTDTRAVAEPTFEFTRGGVIDLSAGGNTVLQRVGYRLEDDHLVRLSWPVLDRGPQSKPTEATLLKNVEAFSVRFLAPNDEWLDQWPIEGVADVLPRGIEVTLELKDRGEFTRSFVVNE
jgi:general secretion pathway protein J